MRIVVMERALADGLLKVVSGRQEGREFYLDKPVLTVGRDERCDVALFGDPSVLPRHAAIRQESGRYVLQAEPGAPVAVNRQPVTRHVLAHENELMIGNTRLIYRSRKAMGVQDGRGQMGQPAAPPTLPPQRPPAPPPRPYTPPVQPQPQVRYCRACGAPNRVDARFCSRCGKPVG